MHPTSYKDWSTPFLKRRSVHSYWFVWATFWSTVVELWCIEMICDLRWTSGIRPRRLGNCIDISSLQTKKTILGLNLERRELVCHMVRWGRLWIHLDHSLGTRFVQFWDWIFTIENSLGGLRILPSHWQTLHRIRLLVLGKCPATNNLGTKAYQGHCVCPALSKLRKSIRGHDGRQWCGDWK